VLTRLVDGEKLGTRFLPVTTSMESRKRYILAGGRAAGYVRIDEGAAQALQHGRSLLPVGAKAVEGAFERGDTIRVTDAAGREIARGIANYSSTELRRICGQQSDAIDTILGYNYGEEVIHRNDLVLL
jgi:glutamate 5-kinase